MESESYNNEYFLQPEQPQGEEDTPMIFSSPFRQKIVVETKELRRVEVVELFHLESNIL